MPVTSSRTGHLPDARERGYRAVGSGQAAGGDEVFRQLVLARIIEPASKLDSLPVLEETGCAPPSYATLKRRLPAYATETWRGKLPAACATHPKPGRASLVLYDPPDHAHRPGPDARSQQPARFRNAPLPASADRRARSRRRRSAPVVPDATPPRRR